MMYTNTSIEINLIKRFLFIHYRFFKTNDVKEHSQFIIIIIIIIIIIFISHLAFKVARLDFLGGIPPKFKH